jgi:hypothetical protein
MRSYRVAIRGAAAGVAAASILLVIVPGVAGAGTGDSALHPYVTAHYRCNAGIAGSITTSSVVNGKTPSTAKVGERVHMTGFQSTVSIPGSIFDKAYRAGVRTFSGKVSTLDITAADARNRVVNVAKTPFKFGPIKLLARNNPSLTVHIPTTPRTIGPWTAKAKGTMTFRTGTNVIVLTASGLGSVTAVCSPAPAVTLSTTKVG